MTMGEKRMPILEARDEIADLLDSWLTTDENDGTDGPIDPFVAYQPIQITDGYVTTECLTDDRCSTNGSCGTTICVTQAPCVGSSGICGC